MLQTHTLFVDAFLQNNRLDHVTQVMGFHPLYLDHVLKTQSFILRGDGPLPFDYRHYIAIMVRVSAYIGRTVKRNPEMANENVLFLFRLQVGISAAI